MDSLCLFVVAIMVTLVTIMDPCGFQSGSLFLPFKWLRDYCPVVTIVVPYCYPSGSNCPVVTIMDLVVTLHSGSFCPVITIMDPCCYPSGFYCPVVTIMDHFVTLVAHIDLLLP